MQEAVFGQTIFGMRNFTYLESLCYLQTTYMNPGIVSDESSHCATIHRDFFLSLVPCICCTTPGYMQALGGQSKHWYPCTSTGDRLLQLLIFNEEFLVCVSHQLVLITSLPFVHTARRSYRLSDPVNNLDHVLGDRSCP